MISVVLPTLNAARSLTACLAALAPGAISGLVREVVVADGGSKDETCAIADDAGARIVAAPAGRGAQLAAGADVARGDWLLFLHADTILSPSWEEEAAARIFDPDIFSVFTLKFNAPGVRPAVVAGGAMARTRIFKLPYGDQGLLVSRALYDEVGGYARMALFEDVDMIERLVRARGRCAMNVMRAEARTSADKYERNGYVRQVSQNFMLLMRYKVGVAPDKLARGYK